MGKFCLRLDYNVQYSYKNSIAMHDLGRLHEHKRHLADTVKTRLEAKMKNLETPNNFPIVYPMCNNS